MNVFLHLKPIEWLTGSRVADKESLLGWREGFVCLKAWSCTIV